MAERSGSAVKGNGFDPKLTKQFVKDIERLFGEMDSKKGEYMAWCQKQRELINGLYDRAKDAGIPKKDLKAVVKIRQLTDKIEELVAADEDDERAETIEMIRHALGDLADTPLGEAAQKGKGGKSKGMPGADAPGSMN